MVDFELVCYDEEGLFPLQGGLTGFIPVLKELGQTILDLEKNFSRSLVRQGLGCSLELSLVDSENMRHTNREARGKDQVTDVLSFPYFDLDTDTDQASLIEFQDYDLLDPTADAPLVSLGDLVICPTRVQEQADDLGQTFAHEFCFLFMHGFLHLLGYDHQTKIQEKKMFDLQKVILPDLEKILLKHSYCSEGEDCGG